MKLEKRKKYLDLINCTTYGLCNFCKYAEWEGGSCCEADLICTHPLEIINDGYDGFESHSIRVWQGGDCWAYRPNMSFYEIAKRIGIYLEGKMPHYSETYGELIAIVPSKRDKEYYE